MSVFQGTIPTPRRYEVDQFDNMLAAQYRQMWETLSELGYNDPSLYARVMRACGEIIALRRTEPQ